MKPDQDQILECSDIARSACVLLANQLDATGAKPRCAIPVGGADALAELDALLAAWRGLAAQLTAMGLSVAWACPAGASANAIGGILSSKPDAAAPVPVAPKAATPPVVIPPPSAQNPPLPPPPSGPVRCSTWTEVANHLKAGRPAVIDRPQRPPTWSEKAKAAIEAARKIK
jgi:hypothetical protein